MIRLLLVLFFTSLLASSAFVAIKVPFLTLGMPRSLPGAEALYQWHGWVFGSHVITAQLPVIWLAGALVGPRRGGLAAALYLALGLGGVPIFTNGGGFAYLKQPTFGYLMAFVPAVVLVGLNGRAPDFGRAWRGMALGLFAIQGVGLAYEVVLRGQAFNPDGWLALGSSQVLQFLPGQIALMTVVAFVVACWRKLESRHDAWWQARRRDQAGPLLPDELGAIFAAPADGLEGYELPPHELHE